MQLNSVDLSSLLFVLAVAVISFHLGEAFQNRYYALTQRLHREQRLLSASKFQIGAPIPKVTEFMHLMEELKLKKRLGWIQYGIDENKAESIADHMYRMAVMAMLFGGDAGVDISKCIKMALVHDMAESITTDITPDSPITPEEKHVMETDAMNRIKLMLAGNPFAEEAVALWQEYAADATPEAQFVKDLDKSELIYQVVEYEKVHKIDFTTWILGARKKIRNPTLQQMVDHVLEERPEEFKNPSKKADSIAESEIAVAETDHTERSDDSDSEDEPTLIENDTISDAGKAENANDSASVASLDSIKDRLIFGPRETAVSDA